MMKERNRNSASLPTVRRLPSYLQVLKKAAESQKEFISSTYIAEELKLEPIQVRKDLAATGITGQPGVGFSVKMLTQTIEKFLGWDNATDAFVVGAGHLGAALAGYAGFAAYGLNIVALFDVDETKIGKDFHGKLVFSIEKLANLVQRMHIRIGILTVPDSVAQQAADLMVDAGIKGIWNFTSVKLNVPEDVIVERVGLAASLAVLSSKLREIGTDDD